MATWHLTVDLDYMLESEVGEVMNHILNLKRPLLEKLIANSTFINLRLKLIDHGFDVQNLPEIYTGLSASHKNAHAMTLFLIKHTLPEGITLTRLT